jgi:hypothetical protein
MSHDDVVITFDSAADVWRIQRGDVTVEIPLDEMLEEYYRWKRNGSPGGNGSPGDWHEQAEAFCRRRLDERPDRHPSRITDRD